MKNAATGLITHAVAPTDSASISAISSSQPGEVFSAPLANARRRVRAICRSVSASTNWLNAPAAAEATSTDNASTSTCHRLRLGPGVIASPASALIMISTPMRSLKIPITVRAIPGAARGAVTTVVFIAVLPVHQLRPHSVDRYFQLMK